MTWSRYLTILASLLLTGYVLAIGRDLLLPLVLALTLYYLILALSANLARWQWGDFYLPMWGARALSLIIIFLVINIFISLVETNVSEFVRVAPAYQAKLITLIQSGFSWAGLSSAPTSITELFANINLAGVLSEVLAVITSLAGNASVIVIYVLFLLLEHNQFRNKIAILFAKNERWQVVQSILKKVDKDIRTYWRIKTLVSLATGILTYIILSAFDLDFAGFWALLTFLFNFIPTIGSIIAVLFATSFSLLQFDNLWIVAVMGGILAAIQFLIGSVLEPRLMGRSLNLSPIVILLSLVFWGSLWGIIGMLLSVPIMSTVNLVLAKIPSTRPLAILLSADGLIEEKLSKLSFPLKKSKIGFGSLRNSRKKK